jgi:hypothetical protein
MACHGGGVTTSLPLTIKIPPTVDLSASLATITAGDSTVLSWSSTNATYCQAISPAGWTMLKTVSGEQSISPKTNTTYTLACQGNGGTTDSPPVSIQVKPLSSGTILPAGNVTGPWKLVFDSEFNGNTLDQTQWSTGVDGASGITDGYDYTIEQECYDPAQVGLSAGVLELTAIAKTESCPPISGTLPYVSGTVTTYGHFSYTYGYAEAEIWLPGTTDLADWPAFWELGQLYDVPKGEIDIVESLAGQACATFHNGSASPSFCSTGNFTGGWHTFAADWEPGVVNYYYDGTKILSVTSGVTSYPMYLVLDLALSTKITSPDTTPATMQVNYVRVWQHS